MRRVHVLHPPNRVARVHLDLVVNTRAGQVYDSTKVGMLRELARVQPEDLCDPDWDTDLYEIVLAYATGYIGLLKTLAEPDPVKQANEMHTFQARGYMHLEMQALLFGER